MQLQYLFLREHSSWSLILVTRLLTPRVTTTPVYGFPSPWTGVMLSHPYLIAFSLELSSEWPNHSSSGDGDRCWPGFRSSCFLLRWLFQSRNRRSMQLENCDSWKEPWEPLMFTRKDCLCVIVSEWRSEELINEKAINDCKPYGNAYLKNVEVKLYSTHKWKALFICRSKA